MPQAPPEPPVLLLLLADCSVKAAGAVVEARVGLVVQAVQAVVAQVVVVAEVAAARMLRVPEVLAAMVGHWYWSSDDGQIRCC